MNNLQINVSILEFELKINYSKTFNWKQSVIPNI